jgi:hypothetical protein
MMVTLGGGLTWYPGVLGGMPVPPGMLSIVVFLCLIVFGDALDKIHYQNLLSSPPFFATG